MVEREMNNLNNDLKEEHCVRKLETRAKFHYHLTKTFQQICHYIILQERIHYATSGLDSNEFSSKCEQLHLRLTLKCGQSFSMKFVSYKIKLYWFSLADKK